MQLIVGQTRTGKTFGVVERLRNDKRKIVVCDPQNSLAHEFLKHTVCSGRRIIVDQIDRHDKTIPLVVLQAVDGKPSFGKKKEEYAQLNLIKDTLYGPRNLNSIDNPTIEEGVDLALKCMMYQRTPAPLYWTHLALMPDQDGFGQLYNNCTNENVRRKMLSVSRLHDATRMKTFGPAANLLSSFFDCPSIGSRCGTHDLSKALDENDILICSGGDADEIDINFILQSWIIQTCRYVKKQKIPIVLVVDEAANWKLMPRILVQSIAAQRKHGLEPVIITQSMNFEEEVVKTLEDNAQRIELFKVQSDETASRFAELFGTRTFDPDKKDTTWSERQLHDGYTAEGKAVYKTHFDERSARVSSTEQIKKTKQDILELKPRERFVADHQGVRQEKTPELEEGFPWPGVLDNYVKTFFEENEKNLTTVEYLEPTGESVTRSSGSGRKSTSAQPNTSSTFSRVGRKRTKGRKNSGKRKS